MSYTRTVSSTVATGYVWQQNRKTGSGAFNPWTSQTTAGYTDVSAVKSGTSNPQWRTQVKSGNSAGTPYSVTGCKVLMSQPGTVVMLYSQGSGPSKVTIRDTFTGFNRPHTLPVSYLATFTKADNDALSQVLKKIDQAANEWKGAKTLLEFASSVKQFSLIGSAFLKFTADFCDRKYIYLDSAAKGLAGSKGARAKLKKLVADTYLEYFFGLAPLMSDAESAAKALARFNYEGDGSNNPDLRKRAVGRGTQTLVKDDAFTINQAAVSKIIGTTTTRESSEARVQYIVGLSTSARADFGSLDHFLKLTGFTPAKLPAAVWEAVPWSWVADYFSNMSTVLDSVGTDTSAVKWIVKTTIMVDTREVICLPNAYRSEVFANAFGFGLESITGSSLGSYKIQKTALTRSIPTTLGWPTLTIELPLGDEHLGKKLANLYAIMEQKKSKLTGLIAGFALAGSTLL